MEAAFVLEATVVLEATSGTEARAMHATPPAAEAAPASPVGVDRGGEDERQQRPHEPETDDLLHVRLLPGGLHGCEVSPPWRLERETARPSYCIVTLQIARGIPVFTFHGLDMQIERSTRERIAVGFAETLAVDHHNVDDALWTAMRRHFSEAEIPELAAHSMLYIEFGRLNEIAGVDPV
jgi:hypothetical protein